MSEGVGGLSARRYAGLKFLLMTALALIVLVFASSPAKAKADTTGSITGMVTDASTHAGIANVQVSASTGSSGTLGGSATSDSNGHYTVSGLASGSYKVQFSSGYGGNYITQFYNGKSSLANADAVSVTAGQATSGIDAALQAGGQITGMVTDASTHSPLKGMAVGVFAASDSSCNTSNVLTYAFTASDGTYTIPGLATGAYKVGFGDYSGGRYVPQFYNGESSCSSADLVSATAAQTTSGINAALSISTTHTLAVSPAGSGSGSVSSSPPGIDCEPTCSQTFTDGTAVTLTATAVSGSTFAGWSGGGCSGTSTCQITMNADTTVTATFTAVTPPPSQHTLTVTLAGTGSGSVAGPGISCPGNCSHSYDGGTVVTLTASAASGSTFAGWSGGGCSGTSTCQITLGSDRSVTATFAPGTPPPRPALSGLKASPRTFVLAGRLVNGRCVEQTRANRHQRRCTRQIRLQITYQLTVFATVTLTIQQVLAGRLVNGRCVTPTHTNRHHRSCARFVALHGALTRTGVRGTNAIAFDGRIAGHELTAGSYQLTATPSLNGRPGKASTITFTIAN